MIRKTKIFALVLVFALGMLSCSKNDGADPDDNIGGNGDLTGKLIYTFTGDVYQLNLQTNQQSTYFTFNTYGFNSWDMGRDGQFRLISEREAGVFDAAKITLVRNSDGTIVDEFDYVSPNGTDTDVKAWLSPDNEKVLYNPTLDNGIVITDLNGNVLTHLEAVNTESGPVSLGITDEVLWLTGNRILFTLNDRYIFTSDPPYSNLTLIKEMPNTQWGSLRVNKQGTQLAIMANNHIYVMDVDGQNFRQVTASSDEEIHADFSPDGNHLLVAKKIGPTFFYWNLAIVPNDGQLYDMDRDNEVIVIQPEGEVILAAVDCATFWVE